MQYFPLKGLLLNLSYLDPYLSGTDFCIWHAGPKSKLLYLQDQHISFWLIIPFKSGHSNWCSSQRSAAAVQLLNHIQLFAAPWTAARQASLSFSSSRTLLKFTSTEMVTSSNHLILSCPLLLLPSIFPSIRGFCNESALHISWPKYWSFSISPSNEYSGLISFRIDWFDLQQCVAALISPVTCLYFFFSHFI